MNRNLVKSSPVDDSVNPATVQLLVKHDENRRRLADHFRENHDVVESVPAILATAEFDLCIVDGAAFESHREALHANKEEAAPVFRPILLVTDRDRIDRLPDRVWDLVDEILTTPVDPTELSNRIENLLQRRRLSLDLKRRKEHSDERFRTLFDTAPDPIVVTDDDGTITDVNKVFGQLVGRAPEDLIGTAITDLGFSPSEAVERILLRVDDVEGEDGVTLEVGSEEPMITEINADIVTAIGNASERIGIFRDVTERERREAEMREQNERLEEFASTIAHDLRNPLSIAKGHLDLARNSGEDEYFETVAQAHSRMEQLIDEILTLARQGQRVMDPEAINVADAARAAWKNTETEGLTISIEAAAVIEADESRLIEYFENLFRNVREHGGNHVTVGLLDGSGFYVADDGDGIPESDREEIFEAGFTSREDGTGFGLSIVRQIVDGHGWEIAVTDGNDGGARFEITGVDFR